MPLFRKRPVVVEAVQWFPGRGVAGVLIEPAHDVPGRARGIAFTLPDRAYVTTIHGEQATLAPGDWVITEPDGIHHYPCKPDIFAATYEPVETREPPEHNCVNQGAVDALDFAPCPECEKWAAETREPLTEEKK